MADGTLRLFRWKGVPVLLHWSALLLPLFVVRSTNRLAELLAIFVLVLVHELGHAVLVRRYKLEVTEIRIYAFGGECWHEATRSMRQQVVIAWGGVLAQLAVFAAAALAYRLGLGRIAILGSFLHIWTGYNLAMIAFNLLPFAPLDGHKAWRLKYLMPSGHAGARRKRGAARVDNGKIVSLVDDALERARADGEAQRRARSSKPSKDPGRS